MGRVRDHFSLALHCGLLLTGVVAQNRNVNFILNANATCVGTDKRQVMQQSYNYSRKKAKDTLAVCGSN